MPDNAQDMSMAVNIPPNAPPHIYAAAAAQFLEWGRADGALRVSELGIARHPNYTGLRMFRAEALILHRRIEQGEEDLRAVLAAEPQHPRAVKVLAHLLMTQKRFREAVPLLERAEFICMGDPDIPAWLDAAEKGAEEQAAAPPPPAPPSFVMALETTERVREIAALPGIRAITLSDEQNHRFFGEQSESDGRATKSMESLERDMGSLLADAGFGCLTDASLQDAESMWASRLSVKATVRVSTDASVREGLVAWHLQRILGEGDV
ncbi:MAG TPA: hypothetical protein VGM37_13300 [Armatimonadota bacterium]|jgi:tetratricopeptide (TPR) repeat protein